MRSVFYRLIYHIVDLGRDYHGKIHDFAEARNTFLADLPDNEYVLYKDSDVELTQTLKTQLDWLKPVYPWYDIRQINLREWRFTELENPFFTGVLASNRVHWEGRVHEKLYPRNPHGRIDAPLIHNHLGPTLYNNWNPPRVMLAAKKLWSILRQR